MNGGPTFVAQIQAAVAMEPRQSAFDDPPRAAEATAVGRASLGQVRPDASRVQVITVGLRIVGPVALDRVGFASRAARPAAQGRDRVDQREQLRDVVPVGRGEDRREGDAARIGQKVMFRSFLAAIGRVRSSLFPPRNARSEALSTRARARSSWPRRRNSARSTVCSRFQTPARCQRSSRRQQVLPDPHPISLGSICHGNPERSTKTIPVSAARSGTRGRPIDRPRRRRGRGSRGSIRAHNASSMRRWDMRDRLAVGHATVPSRSSMYKWHVSHF